MKHRICPNCGNSSPDAAAGCPCGFLWSEGVDVPAPDIVRARVGQRSAADQVDSQEQNREKDRSAASSASSPASAAPSPVNKKRNTPATSSDKIAAHDKQDHPLHTSGGPRRRATAPATFGTNAIRKPREQSETIKDEDNRSSNQVFLGMGEETMVIKDNLAVAKASSAEPAASSGTAVGPNAALLMECPACDARISKRATRCPKCNTPPYQPCQICATTIMVNSESCGECGDPDPFNAEAFSNPRA